MLDAGHEVGLGVGGLAGGLDVRERLAELRRAGGDLTADMTQSFSASVERLSAQIGEAGRRAA